MTNETKERIKAGLNLLFLPITGFNFLLKECKNDDYQNFFSEWFGYLLLLIVWCGCVAAIGFTIWGLIYHFNSAIIPVSIIGGGVFVFFILPVIIHKLIHRK
jgi:hypothetical protein